MNWSLLSLVLLAAAIALSPSVSLGMIGGQALEIRAEDILLVLFGLTWLGSAARNKAGIPLPPLFLPILAVVSVGALSIFIAMVSGAVAPEKSAFFFLKELEFFFLYFFVFSQLKTRKDFTNLVTLWIIFGSVHFLWIFGQFITGIQLTYHYSYTTFIEPKGTMPGGVFLLLISLFLFNLVLYAYPRWGARKILYALGTLLPLIGVFTSGSRGVFFAFLASFFLSLFLYAFRKKSLAFLSLGTAAIVGAAFLLILSYVLLQSSAVFLADAPLRSLQFGSFLQALDPGHAYSRAEIWADQWQFIQERNPFFLTFGLGKGVVVQDQAHSIYLHTLNETGILGLGAFLFLIGSILWYAWKGFVVSRPLQVGVSAGVIAVTVVMLTAGITGEIFQVVKASEVYWFFLAMSMAVWKKKLYEA